MNFMKASLDFLIAEKKINTLSSFLSETEKALIFQRAEELMQQTFIFDKPWDMERCLTPYRLAPLDWNAQRNDDEEWCFMLNRMDYLDYLILASLLSHEIKYAEQAKHYILDWIAAHSQIKPEPSTRTLDTGIRVMNWFEALPYLEFLGCLSDCERDPHHGQYADTDAVSQGKLPAQVQDQQLGQYPDLCDRIRSALPACRLPVRPALSVGAGRDDPAILHSGISGRYALGTIYDVPYRSAQLRHEGRHYMGLHLQTLPVCGQRAGVRAGQMHWLDSSCPRARSKPSGDSDRVCARDVFSRGRSARFTD